MFIGGWLQNNVVFECCVRSKTNESSMPGQQTNNVRKKKKKKYGSQVRYPGSTADPGHALA